MGTKPPFEWYASQCLLVKNGFLLLNVWLVFHLFAIAVCPASVEPSSPLTRSYFRTVSPYLHALFLDHGFHYFAPDPGASTLVAYQLEFADGSTQSGRFPNRNIHPRLFYHRFFMLSEFLGNGPEKLQPLVERAFARNLCRETGATRVTLTMVQHYLATMDDIVKGLPLDDSTLLEETTLRTYTVEELQLPFEWKADNPKSESDGVTISAEDPKETP